MSSAMEPSVEPSGDRAVLVQWPCAGYSEAASSAALALARSLRERGGFREVVPGYASVMAEFDPGATTSARAVAVVEDALASAPSELLVGRTVDIPVRYGGKSGPDLSRIADHAGVSEAQVVAMHARSYRVCMMGFVPGFAFLSAVDARLAHPRHASPRALVPAGSVGIAGWQTGVYGLDSPGGWQIIGRTDVAMFDAGRDPAFVVEAGDTVRFVAL